MYGYIGVLRLIETEKKAFKKYCTLQYLNHLQNYIYLRIFLYENTNFLGSGSAFQISCFISVLYIYMFSSDINCEILGKILLLLKYLLQFLLFLSRDNICRKCLVHCSANNKAILQKYSLL